MTPNSLLKELREKPTKLQKRAVDNMLSGDYESASGAMKAAGYSDTSAVNPRQNLFDSKGVQNYLKVLGKIYKNKTGKGLAHRVMEVYVEGLDAEAKPGVPDHNTRKKFADEMAKFMGWKQEATFPQGSHLNQYNFFSTPENEQQQFNSNLKKFLRSKSSRS